MSLAARQGRHGQGQLRALSPGSFDDAPENWRILEYELGWQSCPKSEELREVCLQNSHPVAELNPIQSDTLYTAFRNDSCGPSAIALLGRKPQW
eukprot:s1864_g2.t1